MDVYGVCSLMTPVSEGDEPQYCVKGPKETGTAGHHGPLLARVSLYPQTLGNAYLTGLSKQKLAKVKSNGLILPFHICVIRFASALRPM